MATAVGVVASMAACGDDADDATLVDGTGPAAAATLLDYANLLIGAQCEARVACCGQVDGITLEDCVSNELGDLGDTSPIEAAIADGRRRLDASAATTCAEQLRVAGCGAVELRETPASRCREFVVAATADGGSCLEHEDCTNATCMFASEEAAEGTCTDMEGQPCGIICFTVEDGERRCGESCGRNLLCAEGICTALETYPQAGEPCPAIGPCAEGTWCNPDNVCEDRRPGGAPCNTEDSCDSDECVDGVCVAVDYC
jgi:hypothetical protein